MWNISVIWRTKCFYKGFPVICSNALVGIKLHMLYIVVVQLIMSDYFWFHGRQHTGLPCPSPSPGVCSNSSPLSQWCHPAISSYVLPFSSCLQSFPASGSFPMRQFFASGGQSIGAPASVLPMNIQGWFPLGWTGLITLRSKELSRVFSSTQLKGTNSSALSLLCGPTLTFRPADWKNYSFDYTAAFILYQLAWC